jgi:hypothetical protein
MEKLKTLPILNPCIPRILPCNNCITLGICKSMISGLAEDLHNKRYGSRNWTSFETKRYIFYNALIPLTQKCSDLDYYIQPDKHNYPITIPRDGWRLTNAYSALSYLNMKLFCEFRDAVHLENKYRETAIKCRVTF